jgi:transmembrane protein
MAVRQSIALGIGAALLTSVFWWSGLTKLGDFPGTLAEMAHFKLEPPWLFAAGTISLQLGASALVIFGGRLAWAGAAALALFTLAAIKSK